jgi:hypothetical protein
VVIVGRAVASMLIVTAAACDTVNVEPSGAGSVTSGAATVFTLRLRPPAVTRSIWASLIVMGCAAAAVANPAIAKVAAIILIIKYASNPCFWYTGY